MDMINLFVQKKGYRPTLREIVILLGFSNHSSAQYFVDIFKQNNIY